MQSLNKSEAKDGAAPPARRPYRLGKRAAAVDATRQRILDAAFAEFTDHGIDATSMLGVARRADLAPGTVLYHFATIDDLAAAVVRRLAARAAPPAPAEVPVGGVGALIRAMYGLYERMQEIYPFYVRNHEHPLLVERLGAYQRALDGLLAKVLAPYAAVPHAPAVVGALLEPPFYFSLRRRGLDLAATVEAASELAGAATGQRRRPRSPVTR
jgi:AcrR family transcriptional regulator